ncbi:MAG TPA: gamma-glutamyl-gamma-aminobutyrate hydrolase family protein [Verrucomicrobiae bacterium]|jgi:putative glutamine amidotransferase|nr:gamma-glutamyl-gamma-aminobutyrate hydrolase family protein [Verrucomicrobiae bacterium]
MAKHPLILISPSVEKRGIEFQDLSTSLSLRYEKSISTAGGLPMLMPTTTDKDLIAESVERADGILLTGGDDICPDLYLKRLPRKIRATVEESPDGGARDLRELLVLHEIFKQRKPLLAICRGHQLLNISLGGTLFVDIPSQLPEAINHARSDKRNEMVHQAQLTEGSLLARITNERTMGVNSAHHQAVDRVAEPLRVTARSPDGVVEGMELKPETRMCLPFLLSVQFHPERMADRHPEHAAIFRAFVQACKPKSKRKL